MPDSKDELLEIRQAAAQLTAFMQSVTKAIPETSEGTDSTEIVRAEVGKTGQLISLQVEPGWGKTLDAEELAPAITSAISAAQMSRLSAMSGGKSQFVPPALPADQDLPELSFPPASAEAIPIGQLSDVAEEVLAYSKQQRKDTSAAVSKAMSTQDAIPDFSAGPIYFSTRQGIVGSCEIQEGWARGRSSFQINSEIAKTIENSITDQKDNTSGGDTTQLDSWISGLLGTLRDLTQ